MPLNPGKIKTIAVIGPNADRDLLGGYSGVPKYYTSPCSKASRPRSATAVKVPYSEGCKITVGGSWNQDEVTPSDPAEDRKQIAEAVKVAQQADVIVLAIGGNEQTSREAWSLKHMGDRTSLDLVGRQEELVKAMLATGKPVIVLLFNGRPLVHQLPARRTCRRFSNAGISARKPATRWRKFCLAITIPAASCPSPFRAPPAICRCFTITSPPPGAAICSTMSRRCIPSASV